MIDPSSVALFIPAGLKKFKLTLFERIGAHIKAKGGRVVHHDAALLDKLPADIIPIVGCQPESTALIVKWRANGRKWIYWDRGYARRVFATWLPRGDNGGYYRWHVGSFQLQTVKSVPSDRWDALNVPLHPWRKDGKHIVVAAQTPTYERFHGIDHWTEQTLRKLALITDRQIVVRDKESKRPLQADLDGAHCLVAHGSIAAVESVILGVPVVVCPDSAAALVALTDINKIEHPVYPDRQAWANALAYSQFNEQELVDGTLWRLMQ